MKGAAIPLILLALAACSDAVDLSDASIDEVASATKAIARPDPGQWSTSVALTAFDGGGRRTPLSEMMRQQLGQEIITDACLSPEDARKPLFGDLVPTKGADCRFARFAYKDGKLDATMTCRNGSGERLQVRQQGSYSSTAVDLTSTIRRAGADGKPAGGMTTHMVAKRTGDCTEGTT